MLFSLFLTVASSARHLHLLNASPPVNIPYGTPNFEIANLSKRWRAERNLWLSAFAFTMWAVLAAFYRELSRRIALEERLAEFEISDYTGTIDTTRDASMSKEVTSQFNTIISPRKSPAASPVKLSARRNTGNAASKRTTTAAKAEDISPAGPPEGIELSNISKNEAAEGNSNQKLQKKDQ